MVIREVCRRSWIRGIQNESQSGTYYEVKLSGTPWTFVSANESSSARRLLKNLVSKLSEMQYDLYCNTNLSGTADTLFFRHSPELVRFSYEYFALSLNQNDRIRLIDVPEPV